MHQKQKYIYIGVDTHKSTHTAVIINCWGEKLGEITVNNKPSDFIRILEEVKKHKKRGLKEIYGLEDCGGVGRALAVFLLHEEKAVKEVDSSLANVERKALPIYHKDDSFDALCVARVLLSRLDELRDANPQDLYWTINQLVERRTMMVKTATALKNQLHVQIAHNYPSYQKFFSEIDGKTALEFWEKYPSPAKLKNATLEELTEFLFEKSHRFFTEKKAIQICKIVESDGNTELKEYQYIRDFLVESITREIKFIENEVIKVEAEIKAIVNKLGFKLHTMNGIDIVVAAKLIGEIGDITRFPTPDKLAKYSGVAPITYSSAQKGKQLKSKQGNRTLYGVFHLLAVHQIILDRNTNNARNPVFRQYYEKKISEGKTSGQAIVCIARRLVNIIWGMMKNKTEYKMPEIQFTPKLKDSKKSIPKRKSNQFKPNLLQQNTK
jgi:transposase